MIATFVLTDDKKEGIFNCVFYTNYHKFYVETWSILHVCFCVKLFDSTQSLLYVYILRRSIVFNDVRVVRKRIVYVYIYIRERVQLIINPTLIASILWWTDHLVSFNIKILLEDNIYFVDTPVQICLPKYVWKGETGHSVFVCVDF